MQKKTTQLRQMLYSNELEFLMEAHNGISSRIAEETGFKGIWGSGLALSAQFGVRDNNEASWTQIVDMVEFMSDVTNIPILLDGDTGYGNFNNMRRLVRKLEQRGVAGVCIEDKLFPKTNSFINGEKQELADIEEFCGKIAAGKDSQLDDDFCIIARIEAFIAGWNTAEALRRAESYVNAGADGILIHSSHSNAAQIIEFCLEWQNQIPVVIVPTKYYNTPTDVFRNIGVSVVIWANQLIRASVTSMQETARKIHQAQSLMETEDEIVPVKEIFRLQGADELAVAEKRYLSDNKKDTQAIILAASRGEQLADLTGDRPKVMIPVNGKPLLHRLIERCHKQQIEDITVIAGYKANAIDTEGVNLVVNKTFECSGEVASLKCAIPQFSDDMVILYGDLIFRGYILRGLIESDRELTVVVDSQTESRASSGLPDYAFCSEPDKRSLWGQDIILESIKTYPENGNRKADGRWIGMLRAKAQGRAWLEEAINNVSEDENFSDLSMGDLLNNIISAGHPIRVIYVHGHWLDVNSLQDLDDASVFTANQI